uniref:hypothetical protein n=1 Tax=Cryobacterium sp. TaxID=1926290 RepID=UPI0015EEACD0|nr:hypothetical protein [Cryobacterium sp.]
MTRQVDPFIGVGVTIVVSGLAALGLVHLIPPPVQPLLVEKATEYVLSRSILTFAAVTAGLAFIGTVMRAGAHQDNDRKRLDYAGKLAAVAAASFAMWGALLSLPAITGWLTWPWVTVGLLAVLAVLAGVLITRHARKKAAAAAAAG